MKVVHPHPSVSEGIQECLRVFTNESIFKPSAFPNYIKIWEWNP
jgi:dihydrolipoamide dehydrogenase